MCCVCEVKHTFLYTVVHVDLLLTMNIQRHGQNHILPGQYQVFFKVQ